MSEKEKGTREKKRKGQEKKKRKEESALPLTKLTKKVQSTGCGDEKANIYSKLPNPSKQHTEIIPFTIRTFQPPNSEMNDSREKITSPPRSLTVEKNNVQESLAACGQLSDPLLRSCTLGDFTTTVCLLTKNGKIDMEKKDHDGRTALILATKSGNPRLVRALIAHGASVNTPISGTRVTPLHIAAASGRLNVFKALIEERADLNSTLENGRTPLYIASQAGHFNVVCEFLLYERTNRAVNAPTHNGATPLYVASQKGHLPVVTALLSMKAEVDSITTDSTTPLFIATVQRHPKIVHTLLMHGANVDSQLKDGVTSLFTSAHLGFTSILTTLLRKGANTELSRNDGYTPLTIAAQSGHMICVRILIAVGSRLEPPTEEGITPLFVAAQRGHGSIVKELISSGANIDVLTDDGTTPLMIAALRGYREIVHDLLEAGANVDTKLPDGTRIISMLSRKNVTLVEEIQEFVYSRAGTSHLEIKQATLQKALTTQRMLLRSAAKWGPEGCLVDLKYQKERQYTTTLDHSDAFEDRFFLRLFSENFPPINTKSLFPRPLVRLVDVFTNLDTFVAQREERPKLFQRSNIQLPDIGSPTCVSWHTWREHWALISKGLLNGLSWNNVIMCGGCVTAMMDPKLTKKRYKGLTEYPNDSHIKLFLYGIDGPEATVKLHEIINVVTINARKYVSTNRVRFSLKKGITKESDIHIAQSDDALIVLNAYPLRHVYIMLRLYKSPAEVLISTDVDCCAVGFDGDRLWALRRAIRALNTRCNLFDPSRRSSAYESRLIKYTLQRGFSVAFDSCVDGANPMDIANAFGLTELCKYEIKHQVEHGALARASPRKRAIYFEQMGVRTAQPILRLLWSKKWPPKRIIRSLNNRKDNLMLHLKVFYSGSLLDGLTPTNVPWRHTSRDEFMSFGDGHTLDPTLCEFTDKLDHTLLTNSGGSYIEDWNTYKTLPECFLTTDTLSDVHVLVKSLKNLHEQIDYERRKKETYLKRSLQGSCFKDYNMEHIIQENSVDGMDYLQYKASAPESKSDQLIIKIFLDTSNIPLVIQRLHGGFHKQLRHPNVSPILHIITDTITYASDQPIVDVIGVVEQYTHTLLDFKAEHWANNAPEKMCLYILLQLFEAVQYLVLNGILHREITLHNVLVSETNKRPVVQLSSFERSFDAFGNSLKAISSECMEFISTPTACVPPELSGEDATAVLDLTKADLWSVGALGLHLLGVCKKPDTDLYSSIDKELEQLTAMGYSQGICFLFLRVLEPSIEHRFDCTEAIMFTNILLYGPCLKTFQLYNYDTEKQRKEALAVWMRDCVIGGKLWDDPNFVAYIEEFNPIKVLAHIDIFVQSDKKESKGWDTCIAQ